MTSRPKHKVNVMTRLDRPTFSVTIETCNAAHIADWATLRAELWSDGTHEEHREFAAVAIEDSTRLAAFLARDDDGNALGFAEVSLRFDYVNGCSTSPVGFLEGLYVREPARRGGIARGLVAAIEHWARERGCTELASDALLENETAHRAHRAIGFAETERVVFFRKALDIVVEQ